MNLVEATCACGAPATANGRECASCWRERVGSVNTAYHPSATGGSYGYGHERKRTAALEEYRAARAEGIQPSTTKRTDVDAAKRASDQRGEAFRADRASLEAVG